MILRSHLFLVIIDSGTTKLRISPVSVSMTLHKYDWVLDRTRLSTVKRGFRTLNVFVTVPMHKSIGRIIIRQHNPPHVMIIIISIHIDEAGPYRYGTTLNIMIPNNKNNSLSDTYPFIRFVFCLIVVSINHY